MRNIIWDHPGKSKTAIQMDQSNYSNKFNLPAYEWISMRGGGFNNTIKFNIECLKVMQFYQQLICTQYSFLAYFEYTFQYLPPHY